MLKSKNCCSHLVRRIVVRVNSHEAEDSGWVGLAFSIFNFYLNLYVQCSNISQAEAFLIHTAGQRLALCKDYLGFPDYKLDSGEHPCSPTLALLSLCGANTHKNAKGNIFNQSSFS